MSEQGLLSGVVKGLKSLLSPGEGSEKGKVADQAESDGLGTLVVQLERALEQVKADAQAMRKPLKSRQLGDVETDDSAGEAAREERIKRIHAEMREDIVAMHAELKSSLDDKKLDACRQVLIEIDKLTSDESRRSLDGRIKANLVQRVWRECAPMGWKVLKKLMTKSNVQWPAPSGLPPWADEETVRSARNREEGEVQEAIIDSQPWRSADRMFGVVGVWKANYPARGSDLWKKMVIQGVAYGLAASLTSTAVALLRERNEAIRAKVEGLVKDELLSVNWAMNDGIDSLSEADELLVHSSKLFDEVVPDMAWELIDDEVVAAYHKLIG